MNQNLLLFAAGALTLATFTAAGGEDSAKSPRPTCCAAAESAAEGERTNKAPRPSCCSTPEASVPGLSDKSLYQLDSTWTNDNCAPMKLASLKGRPQIVCMFFANCQYACPLLVYKLKQIETALPENVRTNVGFLLVSFDTERDTPAELHKYRAQHELPAGRWTLLHGNTDEVLELAAILGVKFKKDAQGQFMHSNLLTVLNAQGEIAFQQAGLELTTEPIIQKLKSNPACRSAD